MWCYYSRLRLTLYHVQEEVDVVLLLAAKINTLSRSGGVNVVLILAAKINTLSRSGGGRCGVIIRG